MVKILNDLRIESFQDNLLSWYSEQRRDLPWRQSRDPYKVWVSEVMLQQTRVDTVIPYFQRFIEKFPTLEALADADEESVLKAWEGLGYYSRARNLQSAVREVKEKYGGKVPDSEKEMRSLKGVGSYTAGAVLSIAYNKPVPAVDGNVMRVLSRVLLIEEEITKATTRKMMEQAARALIPDDAAADFNQALMELGAIVCTPKDPGCLICPVQNECRALKEGMQNLLPKKTKKRPPKLVHIAVAVMRDQNGKFLIQKRPNRGLLANLWEFPNCESEKDNDEQAQLQQFLRKHYKSEAVIDEHVMHFEHIFSHVKWKLNVYRGRFQEIVHEKENIRLVEAGQLARFPFSVSHQKIIQQMI